MKIRYPDGTEVTGEVTEVRAPKRIAFTYGYASGKMIPPGGSRVTIDLEPVGAATRLKLTHEVAEEITRDLHVQGWRYQLSLFANVVADAVNAGAASVADAWFDAWADPDAASRERTLVADRGRRPALPRSVQQHRWCRRSRSTHYRALSVSCRASACSGRATCAIVRGRSSRIFVARSSDGQDRARGTNVFVFGADGRIEWVTGFWRSPAPRSEARRAASHRDRRQYEQYEHSTRAHSHRAGAAVRHAGPGSSIAAQARREEPRP